MNQKLYGGFHNFYHFLDEVDGKESYSLNENNEIISRNLGLKTVLGRIDFIQTEDISVYFMNLTQKKNLRVKINKEHEHIKIYFKLEGSSFYKSEVMDFEVLVGSYSFFYFPELTGEIFLDAQHGVQKALGIDLSVSFIKRLFNDDLSILGDFGMKILRHEAAFFSQNVVITCPMMALLKDIIECQHSGILKKTQLKSKVLELLVLTIQHKEQGGSNNCSSMFTTKDIEKLHYARELVAQNLFDPLSIKELARKSGINEFKLKKGFKELFGRTVFRYLLEERMRLAKKLLLEPDYNISEVAARVGYKNSTHFTSAFKTFFGLLPSDFKQNRLL